MRSSLVPIAVTGLIAGLATLSDSTSEAAPARATDSGVAQSGSGSGSSFPKSSPHCCAGQNACKGLGGCGSSKNGCKGKNACKGQGGCNTKGSCSGQPCK